MSADSWVVFTLAVVLCAIVVWTWREWERQEIEQQFLERQEELAVLDRWQLPEETGLIRFTDNGPRFITKPQSRRTPL